MFLKSAMTRFFKKIFHKSSVLSSGCYVSKTPECITVRVVNYSITDMEKKYQYDGIQTTRTESRKSRFALYLVLSMSTAGFLLYFAAI